MAKKPEKGTPRKWGYGVPPLEPSKEAIKAINDIHAEFQKRILGEFIGDASSMSGTVALPSSGAALTLESLRETRRKMMAAESYDFSQVWDMAFLPGTKEKGPYRPPERRRDGMSLEEIKEVVSRVTYKPGWKLTAETSPNYFEFRHRGRGVFLRLVGTCHNLEKNSMELTPTLHSSKYVERPIMDHKELMHLIREMYREMELHEMNEWLKFDRVCVVDPHPELKRSMTSVVFDEQVPNECYGRSTKE
jgi:hypothetical protein